ncbi:MAG: CHASE4 domain-containing protein [Candidatus Micrarchaeia archaeon]|jgi:signal transduction histidine kinase
MELRNKTLVITGLVSALIMLGIYGLLYTVMYQNFTALEQKNAINLVHDANARLADDAVQLGRTLSDWASWDDTYYFIEDGNEAYVKSNLEDASLAAAHISAIGFYGVEGQTVLVKMVKTGNAPADPVPGELLSIAPDSPLFMHGNGSAQGIMMLGGKLATVASRPILTSKAEGPARGTLLMARYLDSDEVASLAGARGIITSAWQLGRLLPEDYQAAADSLAATGDFMLMSPISDTVMASYFIAKDVDGEPAVIFRVESPRDDYAEFKRNARYMFSLIFVAVVVFGSLNFVLLDWFLLSRIRRLGGQAGQVGKPGGVEHVAPDDGGDEIARLASDINRMLARLRSAQNELLRSQVSYSRRLHGEVKRKTRQLAGANERLLDLEMTKNQFLFNIGHELKSPLAVIEMNLAAAKGTSMTPQQRDESKRMIERNLLRLKQKIEEIIQLSRFEYGKDVQKSALDFSELVKEVARDYRDFASVNGARISLEVGGQHLMVRGDRRLLQYALGNLFSNAVKYCDEKDISAKVERKGRSVEFSIANLGRGVKPENRRKLFRKFFKEDQTSPGTGVGLFMTREIARGHSGDVRYEPNKPRGAIFRFSIPASGQGGGFDEKK